MWREFKLANTIIMTGIIDLSTLIANFDDVSNRIKVESRKGGKCRMQLANAT